MKVGRRSDSGPLTPKMAIWMICPGFTFARKGQAVDGVQPPITEPPFCAACRGSSPSTTLRRSHRRRFRTRLATLEYRIADACGHFDGDPVPIE